MSRRPQVYLAGAIDMLAREHAGGWRADATRMLEAAGCAVFNPLVNPGRTVPEIVSYNERGLADSDVVLAEHAFPVPHWGTTYEVYESIAAGRPVVLWTGSLSVPIYLQYLQMHRKVSVVHSMENAVTAITDMFTRQAARA